MCKNCEKKPVITFATNNEKLCRSCFFKYFERKVLKTIRVHKLIDKKDGILVACSGGKDSTVALYLMNKYAKRRKQKLEAITIDLGIKKYSEENLKNIISFCKEQKIKLHKISFRENFGYSVCYIKSILASKGLKLKSCTICGVLRRYLINKIARKLKATKLITGHNLDDEAQSILMNQFKGNLSFSAKLGPMSGITSDVKFVQRIKPLYFCTEEETKLYSKLMKFPVVYRRCPCVVDSYRNAVRNMLNDFEKKYPGIKYTIVKNFLEILSMLKKKYKNVEIKKCKSCGEPASKEICKTCQIIKRLKG